jgi:hypothetical protein
VDEVKKKKKKKEKAKLSFGDDEEDEGEDSGTCLQEEVIERGPELTYPGPLTSRPLLQRRLQRRPRSSRTQPSTLRSFRIASETLGSDRRGRTCGESGSRTRRR